MNVYGLHKKPDLSMCTAYISKKKKKRGRSEASQHMSKYNFKKTLFLKKVLLFELVSML